MSTKPPQPPNPVPEEDLNLHENFAPIIAENGLIRQPKTPEVDVESLPDFLTRLDTLQDLVELRHAEQEEQKEQESQTTDQPIKEEEHPQPTAAPADTKTEAVPSENRETQTAATTTFLAVRQTTTALVPTSKLTLARRITLLKRKRQHKRRLATRAKAKKRAAQAAAVSPKTPASASQNQMPKRPNRWKWGLAILLFLFLFTISGLVPVEKIPLLRSLAYAMGFDKNDTSRMSFLRALLTWTDKTVGLPGNWSDEEGENYLFARHERAQSASDTLQEDGLGLLGLNARLSREGGQTNLIDMQALNALQRKKGYALDGVQGAVKLTPSQEEADLGPAVVRDDKVNVRTEANRDKGEVFFGSDNSAVNRNFKDGYDSTKALAKIKNPHIADGKPIDWLLNTTQQLMQTNSPLGGLNRQLEGTRVAWGDSVSALGEQKPHRDLYNAWITSRMGNRTPNIMLKKSLADVGFLGADIPMMASTALGGGVQIDSVSFQEDQEAWKEYLEFERKCKEELTAEGRAGEKIEQAVEDFKKIKDDGAASLGLPKNCYDTLQNPAPPQGFVKNIQKVQQVCNDLQKGYETLGEICGIQSAPSLVACDDIPSTYTGEQAQSAWKQFVQTCEDFRTQQMKEWIAKNTTADYTPTEPDYLKQQWESDGKGQSTQGNSEQILNTILTQGNNGFASWIRAKCDKEGNCTPLDMQPSGYSPSVENVKDTIDSNIPGVFKK